ncbi:MAG: thioredoxin family protein [Chloroflexi bacterium]|nr:thioredoxin family protein [Chloroflexota bacterium]
MTDPAAQLATNLHLAAAQRRAVLLWFASQGCACCTRIDAQVLPDPQIADLLDRAFVVQRCPLDGGARPLARRYGVIWTPTLLVLDRHGALHHRIVGALDAPQADAELRLGLALAWLAGGRIAEAAAALQRLVADEAIGTEAAYWLGVAQLRHGTDAAAWQHLNHRHPGSRWARRTGDPRSSTGQQEPH